MGKEVGYFGSFPKALSNAETNKYFQLARNGDENAKMKLKEHNLRLVTYIINKSFLNVPNEYPAVGMEELISTGTFGLMKAVETFDIEKGLKFATYATRCINNEILMLIRKLKKSRSEISLDLSVIEDKEGNETSLKDTLVSDDDVEESYIQKESYTVVRKALEILNDLERQVVELYYGFNGEPMTHDEIGKQLGYSRSYIHKIDAKVKIKLGKYLESQGQGYTKKGSEEFFHIKKMIITERAETCANLIINTKITTGELAKKVGVREVSLRQWMAKTLPNANPELWTVLSEVLEQQKREARQIKQSEREAKKLQRQQEKQKRQEAREQYQNAYDYSTSKEKITAKPEEAARVAYIVKVMNKKLSEKTPQDQVIQTPIELTIPQQPAEIIMMEKIETLQIPVVKSTEETKTTIQECLLASHPQTEKFAEEADITLTTNRFQTPVSLDFERHKDQIRMLISMLNDLNEQAILLLRLGYVRNKPFTEKQIGQFLNMEEMEVHDTIQRGLSNILGISAITMTGVENARQQ